MGLWTKVKGWLNIGGVKVHLWKYSEPISRSNPVITGAVLLKTKSDKTVDALEVKVVEEVTRTEGEGDERRKNTETKVLGSVRFPGHDLGVGYPLELKPDANREQPFSLPVAVPDRLRDRKGVLGGIGKFAAFAAGEKVEYFLVAEASVKGAAFAASDKQRIAVGD